MKLIYRTLLLNKVCVQGSGEARRSAVRLTKRKSLQRYGVYQTTLFFDVYLTWLIFSFQIVNREKRRFLERTGQFYEFTFGISQKSAVLFYKNQRLTNIK